MLNEVVKPEQSDSPFSPLLSSTPYSGGQKTSGCTPSTHRVSSDLMDDTDLLSCDSTTDTLRKKDRKSDVSLALSHDTPSCVKENPHLGMGKPQRPRSSLIVQPTTSASGWKAYSSEHLIKRSSPRSSSPKNSNPELSTTNTAFVKASVARLLAPDPCSAPASLSSATLRLSPTRSVEVTIQNVDCLVAEQALRNVLSSTAGVAAFHFNLATATLLVEYYVQKTSTFLIVEELHRASFHPLSYRLSAYHRNASDAFFVTQRSLQDLTQLTLRIGQHQYRTESTSRAIQHHILSHDGVKACQVCYSTGQLTITYDSRIVGARAVLLYAQDAGVSITNKVDEGPKAARSPNRILRMDRYRFWRPAVGGFKLIFCLTLMSLWLSTNPALLRSCAFNERIPWNLLIEMCVALFTLITTGAPILVGGWQHFWRTKGIPSVTSTIAASAFGLCFLSLVNVACMLFQPATIDVAGNPEAYCSVTAETARTTIRFDIVTMIFVSWSTTVSITRYLRLCLRNAVAGEESALCVPKRVRVIARNGTVQYLPKALMQKLDVILLKPGEVALFDGRALTSAVVKQSPILCSTEDLRPCRIQENQAIYAGTRVMSGDLKIKVEQVGEPLLSRVITSLNTCPIHQSEEESDKVWERAWLYHTQGNLLIGCIVGALHYYFSTSLIPIWSIFPRGAAQSPAFSKTLASNPITVVQALVTAASFWICGSTSPLLAGTTAVRTASVYYLSSLGICLHHSRALDLAAKAHYVVVSRSAILSRQTVPVYNLLLSNRRCMHILLIVPELRSLAQADTSLENTAFADLPSDKSVSSQRAEASLFWGLMWITQAACYSYQTRLGTSNALIRLAHLLIQRARQLYKFESDLNVSYLGAQFPSLKASHVDWNSPKEVKVCPGKGVSVTFCRPRNDGGTNLTHDSTIVCEAAVGSLDYITANHCYGLKEETHEERGKLQNRFQAWAQHRLTNGDDVVFLAVNGFPLGAVSVESAFVPSVRSAFDYLEKKLDTPVWLCTGNSSLSHKALELGTGIPSERIISGGCFNEKTRFLERLATSSVPEKFTSPPPFCVVTTSVEWLHYIASSDLLRGNFCGVLVGTRFPDVHHYGVLAATRAKSVTHILNLLQLGRGAIRWERLSLSLAVSLTILLDAVFISFFPSSAWPFAPVVAILGTFITTASVLCLAWMPQLLIQPVVFKKLQSNLLAARKLFCAIPISTEAVEGKTIQNSARLVSKKESVNKLEHQRFRFEQQDALHIPNTPSVASFLYNRCFLKLQHIFGLKGLRFPGRPRFFAERPTSN